MRTPDAVEDILLQREMNSYYTSTASHLFTHQILSLNLLAADLAIGLHSPFVHLRNQKVIIALVI